MFRLPASASLDEALALVTRLNQDDAIDGILVQSPLPAGMGHDAEQRVFDAVDPAKDVDGFHPVNVGRLVQKRQTLVACTPLGCAELLDREGIPLRGRHAVVIGRSDIVGKPMALLLLHRDATVTICHSRTVDLPAVCRTADVLVAAIGRPGFVTPDFVKPGATVIDVGINRLTDGAEVARFFAEGSRKRQQFEAKGSLLIGDVHPDVEQVAGAITPVPGGVGPLTIAMVLANTVTAAEHRAGTRTLMLRVALTGGIATGKSYVAQRLRAGRRPGRGRRCPGPAGRGTGHPWASRDRRTLRRGRSRQDGAPSIGRSSRRSCSRTARRGAISRPSSIRPFAPASIGFWPTCRRQLRSRWPTSRCCSKPGERGSSMRWWSRRARRRCSWNA